MADRIPQYSMLPNFANNPNILQQAQQQQAQQHQQSQQQDHPNLASFPDQTRLWHMQQQLQQQQQQHQQQQQQFRPRSGADINPNQPPSAQMMEIMRNQTLARVQAQQQQQQFGLSMGISQQMGGVPNAMGSANQQQSFHEPSSNGSQSSHMLQSGFPNMGGMSNANMNAAMQQQQRNANFLLGGSGINRQLELLGMAQNGPNNFVKFSPHAIQQQREQQHNNNNSNNNNTTTATQQQQQQQLQNSAAMSHSSPNDIFSSPGMSNEAIRRPSPSHPPNGGMGPVMPGPQQSVGGMPNQVPRRMTLNEFDQRIVAFSKMAQDKEHEYNEATQQIQARQAQGQPPDSMLLERTKTLANEMKQFKDQVTKLKVFRHSQAGGAQMSNPQQGGMLNMGGGPNQSPWMGAVQSFDGAAQPNRNVPSHMSNQPRMGNNPMLSSGGQNILTQSVPQRTNPASIQQSGQSGQPGPPFGNQIGMSSANGQFPFSAGSGQVSAQRPIGVQQPINPMQYGPIDQLPPPLEKPRFENTYKTYCMSKGVKPDPHALSIDNRPIDLYELHVHVMKEGGELKVMQKDLWSVIGGRMGFVAFPGTDKEPPKCGPGAAQRLCHVYKEYLSVFDNMYITSVRQSKIKMLEQGGNANNIASGALAGGPAPAGQALHMLQRLGLNPQQMQLVMSYAYMSVADLQSRGVQPKMIEFVENNRNYLQRTQQDQKMFANRIRPGGGNIPTNSGIPQHSGASGGGPGQGTPGMFPGNNGSEAVLATRQRVMQQHPNTIGSMDGQPPQSHPTTFTRPSSEQMNSAMAMIQRIKQEYTAVAIPQMGAVEIPIDQRVEYNALIEQVYRQASDIDSKLHMYFVLLKQPELVKKLVAISVTVTQQRNMLSSGNPRYIVSLERLRMMSGEMSKSTELFTATFNALTGRVPAQPHQPLQQQPQRAPVPQNINGHHEMPPRPPTSHPTPSHTSPQQQHTQPPQQIQHQHQPPQVSTPSMRPVSIPMKPKKPPQGTPSNAVSTPSPAPITSAPTPVQNAPTPTATSAASPQAPKSPKGKAVVKTKPPPQKRRPSKATAPTASIAPTPDQTSPVVTNGKRPREEEQMTAGVSPGPAPVSEPSPPKRLKTEWESAPDDSQKKKEEAVENIKTEEDASMFLEQMTELIKMAAGGEGQESLTTDISETLDMILKGYTESSGGRELSPPSGIPTADAFDEDETATPDLVPSSTKTNGPHHAPATNGSSSEIKTEESLDLLRLGTWKEIDGGESAYYQAPDWKWDSPMPSLEQPWSIFPS
ncbi:hypothetical protein BDQ17DRAFT_1351077 [Cyathus striatus]|nr:hypothetical protein BDQ17DRAFT_1351077 [Cyathus striatus]